MKSKWVTVFAVAIAAVVAISVAFGLASPDGSVGGSVEPINQGPRPAAKPITSPSGQPVGKKSDERPNADLAPAAVTGIWPGRPAKATASRDRVNWCPAVKTTGAAQAEAIFGKKSVDAAACAAVGFVLDQRYSRLSLPRGTYAAKDFDFVLPALTGSTGATYRTRINQFLANPHNVHTRESLGLLLLHGQDASEHASAGAGRVFYGPARTTRGYRDRAAWINPAWSTVRISVDRSKSEPRIVASLDASAAVPVFHPAKNRDDMMTIPTTATFHLRHLHGTTWRIGGWTTITTGAYDYAPLKVS